MKATAGNYSATMLVVNIGMKPKIFDDNFSDDDHYLSASENFLSMPPATINNTLNVN